MNAHWIIKESGAYCSDCGKPMDEKMEWPDLDE